MITFDKQIENVSETSLARFLTRAKRAVRLTGRVNVLVTTDAVMRRLNRNFRRKDRPTDVLSFSVPRELAPGIAGDIAISGQIAKRNATTLGHPPAVELKILMLHGLLHLAGYDHETDNGQMARKEQRLRRELHLPHALTERNHNSHAASGKTICAVRQTKRRRL